MMLNQHDFFEKTGVLQDTVRGLANSDDPAIIEETASRLEGFNYTPPVPMAVDQFLRSTTPELLVEIDRIVGLPDDELPDRPSVENENSWERKLQYISVLVFYFKELTELRNGVPEAWDEVDELYVHD